MDEQRRTEQRTREAAAEPSSVGRLLAFGCVGLWLVTLVMLASSAHIHGF